jgi:membrane protease subunit HflC
MQAYETGLKSGETRLILSPTSDFFRFFGQASGIRPPAASSGATEVPRTGPQALNKGTAKVE